MQLYRISTSEYIEDLSGTGAKLYGGRWNEKGSALLYCSENISLAILEVLVHFDGLTVPENLEILQLELDDDQVKTLPKAKFKKLKKSKDSEYQLKKEGQKWISGGVSLGLRVPSIITSLESNILINPKHENFNMLTIIKKQKMELDERLFKISL